MRFYSCQVGRQSGREIRPYQTSAGEDILLLRPGLRWGLETSFDDHCIVANDVVRDVSEVFNSEQWNNRTATWIYRLAGWLGRDDVNSVMSDFI